MQIDWSDIAGLNTLLVGQTMILTDPDVGFILAADGLVRAINRQPTGGQWFALGQAYTLEALDFAPGTAGVYAVNWSDGTTTRPTKLTRAVLAKMLGFFVGLQADSPTAWLWAPNAQDLNRTVGTQIALDWRSTSSPAFSLSPGQLTSLETQAYDLALTMGVSKGIDYAISLGIGLAIDQNVVSVWSIDMPASTRTRSEAWSVRLTLPEDSVLTWHAWRNDGPGLAYLQTDATWLLLTPVL